MLGFIQQHLSLFLFRYQSPPQTFLNRCTGLAFRHWMRLFVELVIFFIIPMIVSAFFYVNIAVRLAKRNKQAGRNHLLTLAFGLSWLFWVICWSPNAFVIAKKNYNDFKMNKCYTIGGSFCEIDYEYDYDFDCYSGMDRLEFVLSYAILFRIPFQLLYSHLNPLLYFLVLKKFQQHHKKLLQRFFRLILSTKRDALIEGSYYQYQLLQLGVEISKYFKSLCACASLILLGFSMTASIYYVLGVMQNVLHMQRIAIDATNSLNTQL